MKRIANLYEQIISVHNLELADQKARKGKQDTYGVRLHDKNREENLRLLHEALKNKTFKTSPYSTFMIHDPKERIISRLPYYPDRIVHHAIMNILEPIWMKVFTYNTYSCIKGRGIEGCAKRVDKIIRKYDGKPLYCLKLDIRKYYPSVKNDVAMAIIRRKIKDADTLWLLDGIIKSAEGLPIGNYLSQYLANLILAYFMHWINEMLANIIQSELMMDEKPLLDSTEYADDICLFSDNKQVLHCARKHIEEYLMKELLLELKGNWQIFPIAMNRYDKNGRALDYVGYKFFRNQKLIRKRIKQNLCRATIKMYKKGDVNDNTFKQGIASWLGWAKHSNSIHLLKTILKQKHYETCILR